MAEQNLRTLFYNREIYKYHQCRSVTIQGVSIWVWPPKKHWRRPRIADWYWPSLSITANRPIGLPMFFLSATTKHQGIKVIQNGGTAQDHYRERKYLSHGAPPLNLRVAATHMVFTASTTPGPGNHCSLATNCQKLTTCRPLVTSEKKTLFIWSCRCKGLEKNEYTEVSARLMFCSQNIYNFDRLHSWMFQILLRCLIDSMPLSLANSSS